MILRILGGHGIEGFLQAARHTAATGSPHPSGAALEAPPVVVAVRLAVEGEFATLGARIVGRGSKDRGGSGNSTSAVVLRGHSPRRRNRRWLVLTVGGGGLTADAELCRWSKRNALGVGKSEKV